MESDGTNRTQLTTGDAQYYHAAWSPDGKYLTYSSKRVEEPIEAFRISLIEVENPGTPRLIGKGLFVNWINAEKFVAVVPVHLPYGHTSLYSIHSNEPIEVSPDSTFYFPLPDGKHIAISDLRKGRGGWWIKDVGAGPGETLGQILSSDYIASSWPGASLRYLLYQEANGEVWRVSLPEGKRERLPDILNGIHPRDIQLSFDDQQLVFLKQRLDARLVLIENVFK